MGSLYENITVLCNQKGIKPGKMCADIGISRGLITDLKMGRKSDITSATAQKIADYFGISVGYLLGQEIERASAESGKRNITEEDIQFALFGGSDEITEAMYDEVKKFAAYLKQREGYSK